MGWELLVHTLGRTHRVCLVNVRHVSAPTHPAAQLLSLWVESESQLGTAEVGPNSSPNAPLGGGCYGYGGEDADSKERSLMGGPGFSGKRFRLGSRCAGVDVVSVVSTHPAVIFGALVK